ncbi:hypothetical protein [Pseudomonas aeruginosa]|uniref:hypothetical protein n=1 Tax=Pseudomonas aeruginosa TaxID=287 RepID=UPI0008FB9EDD|nr:hypothetical protein [Pseudomonas aeruginosa]HCG1306833.1 hypothetical protein [Pseudomonas aeruginosa]HCG1307231.1 hypothetical protein [Pseudomonas aeruginosa]
MPSTDKKTAEQAFRDAFERLKQNKPEVLPAGSPVTQNNIAREARRDPSALKKDRYPLLILEVQAYTRSQTEQRQAKKKTTDNRSKTEKQKLADCRNQRERLSSIVAAQNTYIEDLLDEIERLKAGKVVSSSPQAWT